MISRIILDKFFTSSVCLALRAIYAVYILAYALKYVCLCNFLRFSLLQVHFVVQADHQFSLADTSTITMH